MKLNAYHGLHTPGVLLVPYNARHVPAYHTWMQDPALQEATASEPLAIDEEYAMQRSWREDRDKLTFIICLPLTTPPSPRDGVCVGVDDAPERMVGDINLFLFPSKSEEGSEPRVSDSVIGELELMIARPELRRQGLGRAALLAFMDYIASHWPAVYSEYVGKPAGSILYGGFAHHAMEKLQYLRVKINESNLGSIHLFESTGFERMAEKANFFGEVELRWTVDRDGQLLQTSDRPVVLEYAESSDA
ncbi:hypothetical protein LTR08_006714 [Meristemomyces frigidus]|nr:hypothetical protein LTR08_006714 [Meristemomyces frigidus]